MVGIIASRRRLLVGAAGLLLAVPAQAQLPAAPRKSPKADDEAIPATEDLMREHGVAERILLIYEAGIRRLGAGEDIEPAIFARAGEIMRDFVHDYHEKSEEDFVFPRFTKAGRMVELVGTLQAQHAAGRKLTARLLEVAPTANTTDKRRVLTDTMKESIRLYRPHLAHEDTDIFPTLRSLVTPSEFDAISESLEEAERTKFGADGFEKTLRKVAALEKRFGTYDISQYTPKT
jgi:hemerythrin-like domain-containing protein